MKTNHWKWNRYDTELRNRVQKKTETIYQEVLNEVCNAGAGGADSNSNGGDGEEIVIYKDKLCYHITTSSHKPPAYNSKLHPYYWLMYHNGHRNLN